MNPTSDPAAALAPPPQPHRPSTSCDRHPDERFTGFCPSCLCERLSVLDQSNNGAASSSSKKPPSISAAALKAIFKPSGGSGVVASNGNGRVRPGFFPELRRTKSYSASKNEGFSGVFEPQRRSCDVRLRSSLWNLFNQDEQRHPTTKEAGGEIEVEPRKSSVREPVFEAKEEGEAENESETDHGGEDEDDDNGDDFEIVNDSSEVTGERGEEEIVEEDEQVMEEEVEEEIVSQEELKPMKDHIDHDSHAKKQSARGSFWSAASVFSKKLQKWRQKQKMKKQRNGGGSARLPVEKPIGRQLRDTQSEIADYGFGRRSCDTEPRFSLDAGRFSVDIGRISLDDPRYSFDEPRASWDGHVIGRTAAFPPARVPPPPSMLSVAEDAPVHRHVARSDMQIPVEEPPPENPGSDPVVPGGSAQTRDFYTDSSSRRRKSLDRSSSIRKTAAGVAAEMDEVKPVSNSKVSPAISVESYASSVRDDCFMETTAAGIFQQPMNGERKGNNNNNKKPKRWSKWSILGFIYRKSVSKYEEEEDGRYSRSNGTVERSLSESWPELRNGGGGFGNAKMTRSNSNVSWRSAGGGLGFGGSGRKSNGGWLERNRSSRYLPKDGENGMLRFYLTPVKGGRRSTAGGGGGGGGWEKTAARANSHGHSIARSVMGLY